MNASNGNFVCFFLSILIYYYNDIFRQSLGLIYRAGQMIITFHLVNSKWEREKSELIFFSFLNSIISFRNCPAFSRTCLLLCFFCCLVGAILLATLIAALVLNFTISHSTATTSKHMQSFKIYVLSLLRSKSSNQTNCIVLTGEAMHRLWKKMSFCVWQSSIAISLCKLKP